MEEREGDNEKDCLRWMMLVEVEGLQLCSQQTCDTDMN